MSGVQRLSENSLFAVRPCFERTEMTSQILHWTDHCTGECIITLTKTKEIKKKKRWSPGQLWAQQRRNSTQVSLRAKFWMRKKKQRNLRGYTSEVASSKSFYPRCPWEEPQRNSCNGKPWLLMKGFAWRRGGKRLERGESQLFPLLKGKEPRRSCTMVCGTYQNIWQTSPLWKKDLRPPPVFCCCWWWWRGCFSTHHRPITLPSGPSLARGIVWAPRVQSGPFRSRSVCADTMSWN